LEHVPAAVSQVSVVQDRPSSQSWSARHGGAFTHFPVAVPQESAVEGSPSSQSEAALQQASTGATLAAHARVATSHALVRHFPLGLQSASDPQQPATGTCTQPRTASHESVVHRFPSSQVPQDRQSGYP
jgi:hypothetical protein